MLLYIDLHYGIYYLLQAAVLKRQESLLLREQMELEKTVSSKWSILSEHHSFTSWCWIVQEEERRRLTGAQKKANFGYMTMQL